MWTRMEGRLVRRGALVEDNILPDQTDDDIILLKADASKAIRKLIVQDQVVGKPRRVRSVKRKSEAMDNSVQNQKSFIEKLPLELMLLITFHLDLRDVENLSRTCTLLEAVITNNFVTNVIMPLSESNLQKLNRSGRNILSLTSSVNIRMWNWNDEKQYERMLSKLKLKYVKEVKFIGPNYDMRWEGTGGLIPGYISIVNNVFLSKKFIRKLEISVDNSPDCLDYLNKLKTLPCLTDLSIRSSDIRSTTPAFKQSKITLNRLLAEMLDGLKITTLEMKSFKMRWEKIDGFYYYKINLKSNFIRRLKIECNKQIKLASVDAPELKELVIESDYTCYCLFHSKIQDNDGDHGDSVASFAEELSKGCPKLETYNGMNLNQLREDSPSGDWLEVLEYHKGEGVDVEEQSCKDCQADDDEDK